MERVIKAVLLTIFLWLADSALAGTAEQEESVGPQACGAFQRDTVPQSIRSAEFIDEHMGVGAATGTGVSANGKLSH